MELKNNLFSSNFIAYNSYRKKWHWEKGGEGVIENTQFLHSVKADLAGDKYSLVKFITRLPENLRVEGKLAITQSLKE